VGAGKIYPEEGTLGGVGSRPINTYIPDSYVRALDELVKEGYFASRGDAIRTAVLRLIREYVERGLLPPEALR